jgi:hypothetical protein
MKRTLFWLLAGCLLTLGPVAGPLSASDRDACPNAAVIYWQAFAAMPALEGQEQAKYEAAIKTPTAPLGDDLKPIVARFAPSMRELHRACAVSVCDWNLNMDAGPEMLLPHLAKARDLSRAALLRARLRFAAGETDAAMEDVLDVLKLARDCGRNAVLISLMVNAAIEDRTAEVLAAHLPKLVPEQLDKLAAALKTLPAAASLADCMRTEDRVFGNWLQRFIDAEAATAGNSKAVAKVFEMLGILDDSSQSAADDAEKTRRRAMLQSLTMADLRESARLLRADYDHLTRIAGLGFAERRGLWAEYDAKLAKAKKLAKREDLHRILSCALTPTLARVADREELLQVRRNLLALAVAVQRHGPDALKSAPAAGPVEYQKTDDGFELRCRCSGSDKPEVLRVGGGK